MKKHMSKWLTSLVLFMIFLQSGIMTFSYAQDVTGENEVVTTMAATGVCPLGKELSLDNVEIRSFKLIDKAQKDTIIDVRTSDQADFPEFSKDPTKFNHVLFQEGKPSAIQLNLDISYRGKEAIKEGDRLTIPAKMELELYDTKEEPLISNGNPIGTWMYKDGSFLLYFAGEYLKENKVTEFTTRFETQATPLAANAKGHSLTKGDRVLVKGMVGKKEFILAFEKELVGAKKIAGGGYAFHAAADVKSDKQINWLLEWYNDGYLDHSTYKTYLNTYLLTNQTYRPDSIHTIYIESALGGVVKEPSLDKVEALFTGINDNGEVVSGHYTAEVPLDKFVKVDQGSRTYEEVKKALKPGQYCFYNQDGSYQLVLRSWDMHTDSNGLTYNDLPEIQKAGGVGSFLQKKYPDIYGPLQQETINKINNIYQNKAVQGFVAEVNAEYKPTKNLDIVRLKAHLEALPKVDITDMTEATLFAKRLDIRVTKEWQLREGCLPPVHNVEVELYKDGLPTGNKLTLKDENYWTGTFTNLEKRAEGSEKDHVYTIKEVGERNQEITLADKTFMVEYTGNIVDGFTVQNKEKTSWGPSYSPLRDLQVKIEWNLKGEEKEPVEEVEVELYIDGVASGERLVLKKNNQWTETFRNLKVHTPFGSHQYQYTVKEIGEDHHKILFGPKIYAVEYDNQKIDGWVIVNKEQSIDFSQNPDTNLEKIVPLPKDFNQVPREKQMTPQDHILPKTGASTIFSVSILGGASLVAMWIVLNEQKFRK